MADVEINVSGTMSPPTQEKSLASFEAQLIKLWKSLESPTTEALGDEGGFHLPQTLSVKAWLSQCYQNLRPWSTFFNTANFKAPAGVPLLTRRIMKNAAYFLSNYVVIVFVLTLYCLITTPLLLLAVCASLGACYSLSRRNAQQPLVLFGHTLSLEQQYALVAGCSIPVYILVGAGSAMFWVLGLANLEFWLASLWVYFVPAFPKKIYNVAFEEKSLETPAFRLWGASLFFTTLHAAFFNISALASDQDEMFEGVTEQI